MQYKMTSLGRMAVFYLPSLKLKQRKGRGRVFEKRLNDFLLKHYGAFTVEGVGHFGLWRDSDGIVHYDEHKKYRVSFLGKERIKQLAGFLAKLAYDMDEQAVYLETGEDAWIVEPITKKFKSKC